MRTLDISEFARVSVVFEKRGDGGLRVYSDAVPGFVLSSDDYDGVLADVVPALETIISALVGQKVRVQLSDPERRNVQAGLPIPVIEKELENFDYVAIAA